MLVSAINQYDSAIGKRLSPLSRHFKGGEYNHSTAGDHLQEQTCQSLKETGLRTGETWLRPSHAHLDPGQPAAGFHSRESRHSSFCLSSGLSVAYNQESWPKGKRSGIGDSLTLLPICSVSSGDLAQGSKSTKKEEASRSLTLWAIQWASLKQGWDRRPPMLGQGFISDGQTVP